MLTLRPPISWIINEHHTPPTHLPLGCRRSEQFLKVSTGALSDLWIYQKSGICPFFCPAMAEKLFWVLNKSCFTEHTERKKLHNFAFCLVLTTTECGLYCPTRWLKYESGICFPFLNFTCGKWQVTWPHPAMEGGNFHHSNLNNKFFFFFRKQFGLHSAIHRSLTFSWMKNPFPETLPQNQDKLHYGNTKAISRLPNSPDLCGHSESSGGGKSNSALIGSWLGGGAECMTM